MSTRLVGLLLLACGAAFPADGEFDRVVKAIESHYSTRHTHVPLMGIANLFVKMGRPAGTSSFRLALFEHLNTSRDDRDEFMHQLDTGRLHPLMRVRSNHEDDATYILADGSGKSARLLIAAFAREEATLIEVRVDAALLRRTIDRPEVMTKSLLGKHGDEDR